MKASDIGAVLVALCLTSACSDSGWPAHEAFYEATACPKPNIAGFPEIDFPATAECGFLNVLEDRASPRGVASASW